MIILKFGMLVALKVTSLSWYTQREISFYSCANTWELRGMHYDSGKIRYTAINKTCHVTVEILSDQVEKEIIK